MNARDDDKPFLLVGTGSETVAPGLHILRGQGQSFVAETDAGLVVIDFIDMEYNSNIRKVEKAMKDALKNDRARIQVGRISSFGLMEMSRQRLRTGVLEATTRECPHCDGTGLVRTASSAGLSALRLIEDEAAKGKGSQISLYASTEAAIYLLNTKRGDLAEIEDRYGVSVEVLPEGEDEGAKMRVASSGPRPTMTPKFAPIVEEIEDDPIEEDEDFEEEDDAEERAPRERRDGDEDRGGRKRRRRRGGRNRRDEGETDAPVRSEEASADDDDGEEEERERDAGRDDQSEEDRPKKRRRRGGRRRRGRGRADGENGGEAGEEGDSASVEAIAETLDESISVVAGPEDVPQTAEAAAAAPKKRTRRKKVEAEPVKDAEAVAETAAPEPVADAAPAKPKRTRKKKAETEPAPAETAEPATEADAPVADAVPAKPKRTRAKKAAVDAPANADAEAPAAANDANGDSAGETRSGKRGWWQRTFGE